MNSEKPEPSQVLITGMEFTAGRVGDRQISEALGLHTVFVGEKLYETNGEYLLREVPPYSEDGALCQELMENRGVVALVLPALPISKKHKAGSVALFELAGELHSTQPQPTDDAALACALWCTLQ